MEFEQVVFTKHARERLELRKISEDMIIQAIYQADRQFVQDNGNVKFIAKTMGCKVHAICKPLPDENKWLVISAWVRGEDDYGNKTAYKKGYQKYNKKSKTSVTKNYRKYNRKPLNYDVIINIILIIAILTVIFGAIWYFMLR